MNFLTNLFGAKPSPAASANDEAVMVYLDSQSLPAAIYAEHDLSTLEDLLMEQIELNALGEFDGNEIGPTESVLYMYGPDADALFSGIEATLSAYPLCANARVVIRKGGPGAAAREVCLS